MQLLEGRKAVVTGGSRGIGREICLLLAENGADVALAYRKSAVEAEQLREEIAAMGRSCIAVQADVSVSADVDRFVTQAAQALGGIDILVNCAGVFPRRAAGERRAQQLRQSAAKRLRQQEGKPDNRNNSNKIKQGVV